MSTSTLSKPTLARIRDWYQARRALEQRTHRDRTIARRLSKHFERTQAGTQLQGLHFFVQDGTVTLYGTVAQSTEEALLVGLIRRVVGVKGVVSKLQLIDARFQPAFNQPGAQVPQLAA